MATHSQTAILNRHDFENSLTQEFDNNQTAATLITPSSGKSIRVAGIAIITEASSGTVRLYFSDDEDDEVNTAFKLFAATNPASGYIPLVLRGDPDSTLLITSDLGPSENYFVLVNYSEE